MNMVPNEEKDMHSRLSKTRILLMTPLISRMTFSLKRVLPTIPLKTFEGYGNTVLENVVRVLSGHFQYKMRPSIPFLNVDDAWLPPRTQVKIKFDLPQTELSRYMIVSDKGGGANNAGSVGPADIELYT